MSNPKTTVTKVKEETHVESNDETSKKYVETFQKHQALNANILNGNSLKVTRRSVEKIMAMMPEKLKYGISYILFSLTSTEVIEEIETTKITKKLVKKIESSEVKECHFLIDLNQSTKLNKGGFNTNIFKSLEKILNIQKAKDETKDQKIKKNVEEAPQSEGVQSNVSKKGKKVREDDKEEITESTKETQKPTKPKKEEPKKEPERRPQTTYQVNHSQGYAFYSSNSNGLQLPHKYRTHPRVYGKDSRACRVCNNTHGLIRKYKLDICRRCFRERATLLGWKQDK